MSALRTTGDWTAELLDQFYHEIETIATEELKLEIYPNQIELITSNQMLDAYSTHAMPVMYNHWRFGKSFVKNKNGYDKGHMNLAFEVVINCLKTDTLVYVRDKGSINIGDINVGDFVFNGTDFVEVSNKIVSKKPTKTVTLDNGVRITATAGHIFPVITENGYCETTLDKVNIGDYFLFNNDEFVETKTTAYLDKFEYNAPQNGYGEKFLYNPACQLPWFVTPAYAELMGIIIGDGSISNGGQRSFTVAVGWDNPGYEIYIKELIKEVFDIEAKLYYRPSQKFKDRNNCIVTVCSNEIKDFIDFSGLNRNSTHKNKRIPWSIWSSNKECKARFLKGLFDTDGCVKQSNGKFSGISFSCYNADLGHDVILLLSELGITSKCKRVDNVHNNITSIEILAGGAQRFYDSIQPASIKKRDRLNSFINNQQKYNSDTSSISRMPNYFKLKYKNNSGRSKFLGSVELDTVDTFLNKFRTVAIVDITDNIGEDEVVDITVTSNDSLFLANNILTHNCNPCIAYLMEENSITMQALVISHACMGHNSFFKNNYLFKSWTEADSIVDYLIYAKKYVSHCEEQHGLDAVERFLDAAHSLELYGVDKYKRTSTTIAEKELRDKENQQFVESNYDDIIHRTTPRPDKEDPFEYISDPFKRFENMEPEENILYFLEKKAPMLETWQRELLRIVRKVAQYFHPQMQSKLSNEGWATFTHYYIMNRLYDKGVIDNGAMLEFIDSHTAVTTQPGFDHPAYAYMGINVYSLGFNMFMDIKRISMEPTDEDREYFPDWAGNGDWVKTVKWAMENFRDESFITQFLSPKLIRDYKMFSLHNHPDSDEVEIQEIHNKQGYTKIRDKLSKMFNLSEILPDIQVYKVDTRTRRLYLRHISAKKSILDANQTRAVLDHLSFIWKFPVTLESVDNNGEVYQTITTDPINAASTTKSTILTFKI